VARLPRILKELQEHGPPPVTRELLKKIVGMRDLCARQAKLTGIGLARGAHYFTRKRELWDAIASRQPFTIELHNKRQIVVRRDRLSYIRPVPGWEGSKYRVYDLTEGNETFFTIADIKTIARA
jgi:hypothetical protein